MSRSLFLSVVVAAGLLPITRCGAVNDDRGKPVFELTKDFTPDQNPGGPWAIGSFNHKYSGKTDELQNLSTYGKLTFSKTEQAYAGGGLRGWGEINAGLFGLSPTTTGVLKNTGTAPLHGIRPGSVAVFPQNGPIVVRWVAPIEGTIAVLGEFSDLTNLSGVPEVWVLHNQDLSSPLHYQKAYARTGKASEHIIPLPWSSGTKSRYHGTVAVVPGDTIDFVVDPMYTVFVGHSEHADGDATDIIDLNAVITYTAVGGFTD